MTAAAAKRAAVVAEARTWLGTPYHHHGRIQGVGVDCAMLLAEVFEACGLVAHVDAGAYATDWHLHRSEEQFIGWVQHTGAREVATPKAGDIGVWRFGRTYSHGGIVLEVEQGGDVLVAHAYVRQAVIATRAGEEPLSSRLVRWFTLIED